jgi:uncharacterized membrane protein
VRAHNFRVFVFFLLLESARAHAQAPAQPQPPGQKPPAPAAKPPAIAPQEPVPAPVSKHYPILIIAHGAEPFWSLRLGMKGPERLDRLNYPPIVLEPAEITREETGSAWTYKAKDVATGAAVAVTLTREPCSDNTSDMKYTFSVVVDHAQIGSLKGCGQSSPDKFPEFHKKNQLDQDDDATDKDKDSKDKTSDKDKDKDKKTVLDPITNFHSPVATAYVDATGRVTVSRGQVRKAAAATGSEPALSHDGKMLLYTRSDSKTGPQRSIVLYEVDTGRASDFAGDNVREAFWSPDDSKIAYLKFDGKLWQVWTAPVSAPDTATLLSAQNIDALHGWVNASTVLATDLSNAYWLSDDKPAEAVPLKDIYGDTFQIMSSDTIRVCPVNPDLLLVSAYYKNAPVGAPTDSIGLNSTFFLYEVRSKRRVLLGLATEYARAAEWSRDGLQIFFTVGVPGKAPLATNRIFWDGTGEKRYSAGSYLVVGK